MTKTKTRVAIGLSGGVDSSVAAYLLKQQGFEVIGLHLKLHEGIDPLHARACCSLDSSLDARLVAHQLDIPFYVINLKEDFKRYVIDPFIQDYQSGRTPNPCVKCNKFIKFGAFLDKAKQLGCDKLATGHYATIYEHDGRFRIRRAKDSAKDQTYMLYGLSQEQLSHIIMPLGDVQNKATVRRIAQELDLSVAGAKDSQDICFVPDDDHIAFLKDELGSFEAGDFVLDGEIIGQHPGLEHFTIGQRKGLGISYQEPLYVTKLEPLGRKVHLGRAEAVWGRRLAGSKLNLIYEDLSPGDERDITAKIRYAQSAVPARLTVGPEGTFTVDFKEAVRAISPGQSVVFYRRDDLFGGGIIDQKLE
ncbi:MAG TPA: tRNA 2-thiouridine(34) synthase MnmA [Tissierellia bacterium]|nr:tRNA 2-thiouridine(34) synthase MnmA [Tissierellia bacterium]